MVQDSLFSIKYSSIQYSQFSIRVIKYILILEVQGALLPKMDQKKWHFEWPNQNSKTTFIVQTFPKYGLYDFYFVNLSLLSAILAIFQFCGFSGLFWPFFPCKKCKNENLSLNVNFWSITLKFFLWTPTTHEHEWLKGLSSIQKKCKNGTPYCVHV